MSPIVAVLALALPGPRAYDGPRAIAAADTGVTEPPPPTSAPRAPTIEPPPPPRHAHRGHDHRRRLGPIRVRWGIDAGITAGAGVPALVLDRWVRPQLPLAPLPTEPADVGRVDAIAQGRFEPRVSTAADVMVALTMAAGPLVSLVDGAWAARRAPSRRGRAFAHRWGTAVLVQAEALALTSVVTSALKHAVGRPRPYTSLATDDVAAGDRDALDAALRKSDRSLSFPSGHSSLAFAAATSLATVLTLDAPRTQRARIVIGLAWSLGLAAAGTTAALRVVAGKHYPSDVLAGAAIGSAIGVVTPLLHARRRRW